MAFVEAALGACDSVRGWAGVRRPWGYVTPSGGGQVVGGEVQKELLSGTCRLWVYLASGWGMWLHGTTSVRVCVRYVAGRQLKARPGKVAGGGCAQAQRLPSWEDMWRRAPGY